MSVCSLAKRSLEKVRAAARAAASCMARCMPNATTPEVQHGDIQMHPHTSLRWSRGVATGIATAAYQSQRFEEGLEQIDVVLDLVGGETQERSYGVLKRGGVLVSTLQKPDKHQMEKHGVRGLLSLTEPNAGQLANCPSLRLAARANIRGSRARIRAICCRSERAPQSNGIREQESPRDSLKH